jgi:hypothetical protein
MRVLVATGGGPAFVFGGKVAARLNAADVRVDEVEVWVDCKVELDFLGDWLARAGVKYVSVFGDVAPAAEMLSPELLRAGLPLVTRTSDLRLRAVDYFPGILERAIHLDLPEITRAAPVASIDDCDRFWTDRDYDHLAVQRTVRLAGGRQAIRGARGG